MSLQPETFIDGYRLIDGTELNDKFGNPQWSLQGSVAATPGGTVANSIKVVATITNVTSAAFGAGITLPQALPGRLLMVLNQAANPITVYAEGGSTIDAVPGNIGITLQPDEAIYFVAVQTNQWIHLSFLPIGFPLQFMQILQNINALRLWSSLPGASPKIIALVDNVVPNDGGGLFWLDASDNTTPDNGTTVIVDAVGNRWKRELVQAGYIANVPYRYITATNVQAAINQLEDASQMTAATITALRSLTPLANASVYLQGYSAIGDGGGGYFRGVTSGSYTDNGGTIVTTGLGVTTSVAWLRVNDGPVSVKCFGAVADGVTDDGPAIRRALAAVNSIYMPAGNYAVMTENVSYYSLYYGFVIRSNQEVVTDGFSTQITQILNPALGSNAQPIVGICGQNIIFALNGISITGNIATRAPIEFDHAVAVTNYITQSAGTITTTNVTIGNISGTNISGDVLFIGQRLDFGPDLVEYITVGEVIANNALRNGVSIVGARRIYIQRVYTPQLGYVPVDVESDGVASGICEYVYIGQIFGNRFYAVVNNPSIAAYNKNIYVGQLNLDPSNTVMSVPAYAPGVFADTQPCVRFRDTFNVFIGQMSATNFNYAIMDSISGYYDVYGINIGELYTLNCSQSYPGYILSSNVVINTIYAEIQDTKWLIVGGSFVSILGGTVSLGTGATFIRGGLNCSVNNVNITGAGQLHTAASYCSFSNVVFVGDTLSGFGSSNFTYENLTATATPANVLVASTNGSLINSTINSQYYPFAVSSANQWIGNFGTVLFAALPTAVNAGPGARAFLLDGSLAYSGANIGLVVAGGGGNYTPAVSDGTDWRVG